MKTVLFVCTENKYRSKTGELLFRTAPGFEVQSCGTGATATVPLSKELIDWASIIFFMEEEHRKFACRKFKQSMYRKRAVILRIPDEYELLEPALVQQLHAQLDVFFGIEPVKKQPSKTGHSV